MKTFEKFEIKNLSLKNRIVMPPMCTYSSDESGFVKDFHRIHYGSRAIGGTGFIIVEAAAIDSNGRIVPTDLGVWDDSHIEGLKSIVDTVHQYDCKIAIQLAHAGRKSYSKDNLVVAPSAIQHSNKYQVPRELKGYDIKVLVNKFKDAARRALEAGFDSIEVHAAHGYLIHEFLSPLTNKRVDEYGGSLANRTRFLKEVLIAIKEVWPEEKPILVRFSATDYVQGGIDKNEIVDIINEVKELFDMAHISTGGLVPADINVFPGYQVSFAERIKKKCSIPTICVGMIENLNQIEEILCNNRSDLVAIGRLLLRDPYVPLHMAYDKNINVDFPLPYGRAFE